jgi:hypothetical protein
MNPTFILRVVLTAKPGKLRLFYFSADTRYWLFLGFGGLTHSRCKRENQNASNSAAFNEIAVRKTPKSEEEPKKSASVAKVSPNVLFYCRKDYFTGRIGLLGQRGC